MINPRKRLEALFDSGEQIAPRRRAKAKSSHRGLKSVLRPSVNETKTVHIPLVAWFRKQYPQLWRNLIHIPNEGRRSIWEGAKLKQMGLIPGCSDLFLAVPTFNHGGFWIELKAPGKQPTKSQLEFLLDMKGNGYRAEWYDNWEMAALDIRAYLTLVPRLISDKK